MRRPQDGEGRAMSAVSITAMRRRHIPDVVAIEGGFFDRLVASPAPRVALVAGRLIATGVLAVITGAASGPNRASASDSAMNQRSSGVESRLWHSVFDLAKAFTAAYQLALRAGYELVLGTRRNGEMSAGAMGAAHGHVLEPESGLAALLVEVGEHLQCAGHDRTGAEIAHRQ